MKNFYKITKKPRGESMLRHCLYPVLKRAKERSRKTNTTSYFLYTDRLGLPCEYKNKGNFMVNLNTDALNTDSISNSYKTIVDIMCDLTGARPLAVNEYILYIERHVLYSTLKPINMQ